MVNSRHFFDKMYKRYKFKLLRAVQSVQYFLENVLINVQNLIYTTSIALRSKSNKNKKKLKIKR